MTLRAAAPPFSGHFIAFVRASFYYDHRPPNLLLGGQEKYYKSLVTIGRAAVFIYSLNICFCGAAVIIVGFDGYTLYR